MPDRRSPHEALAHATAALAAARRRFALVGGLGVSVRAEIRFTRDVDLAVIVANDADAEQLIFELGQHGYRPIATVEHETQERLATARLMGPAGIVIDLLLSSSGIEMEVVTRATIVEVEGVGELPVARAEELLALKVLSMTDERLQDRIDAGNLVRFNPQLDMDAVRQLLDTITARGYARRQDLGAKLDALLATVHRP